MKEPQSAYSLRMRATTRRNNGRLEEVVVYRWGRIAGVFVVLLLALVTVVFMLWSWLGVPESGDNDSRLVAAGKIVTDHEEAAPAASTESTEPVEQTENADQATADSFEPIETVEPTADTGPVSEPLAAETERSPQVAEGSAGDSEPDTTEPPGYVIEDPTDQPEPMDQPSETQANAPSPTELPAENASVAATEESAVVDGSGDAAVTIQSPHLLRAQLTSAIESREPTDTLPTTVSMAGEDLIQVYFFTQLEGLKGHTVFYNWYLDGKRLAQVPVRAHLDRMRASSSKNINRSMLGQWRVEAVTGDGQKLGYGEFTVTE